jgi:acyl-coenzyme A synthetase/AMP-(fatty) acid ligase
MAEGDIRDAIARWEKEQPDKRFAWSPDQAKGMSYRDLGSYCERISAFLEEQGVRGGDSVAIIGKNSLETLVLFLATLYYGAVVSPINADESPENAKKILRRVKPRITFHAEGGPLEGSDLGDGLRIAFDDSLGCPDRPDSFFGSLPGRDAGRQLPPLRPEALAQILFTSGTTSTPKGVCLTRGPFHAMVTEVVDKIGITGDDVLLEYRNYNWASAQLLTIMPTVLTGATLIFARRFSRSRFPAWLGENGVTIAAGVPTVINILAHEPVAVSEGGLGRVRFITSSSAPLSVTSQLEFERVYGIPVLQMMGMSEAGFMLGNPFGSRKTGSAGTPCRDKEVFFVGSSGSRCAPGEQGEMVVRGYSMGLGYLQDDGSVEQFPAEGFRTGDLGYLDEDGFVWITGRAKDLIIRGGVNIAPQEITARIAEHPAVKEAATIGVPDSIYGEEVATFVVTKEGCFLDESILVAHCKKSLPDFKIPKAIFWVSEIPKNPRGKVSKESLLKIYESTPGQSLP